MGFKHDFLHGWYWSNEDDTSTAAPTWFYTYTTGDPIEIKAPSWTGDPIINSPTTAPAPSEGDKAVNPNYAQGWVCPKCGRVNAPWVGTCQCFMDNKPIITFHSNFTSK